MKKFILSLSFIALITSFSFAKQNRVWSDRVFDINFGASALCSNNILGLNDLSTQVLVIDFTKIADKMKRNGQDANISASTELQAGLRLDIPNGLTVGLTSGIQFYQSLNIGKELFYFLGYGNTLNQDIDIAINGFADVFVYNQVDFGWDFKKCKILVSPSIYSAFLHATTEGSHLTTRNTNDGKFAYELEGIASLYTSFEPSDYMFHDFILYNMEFGFEASSDYLRKLYLNSGLDVEANVEYFLNKDISLLGSVKMPFVPSKLSYKTQMKVTSQWETTIIDAAQGNMTTPEIEYENLSEASRVTYRLNRPLKIGVGADFHPWNNLMSYYGTLGLCVEHPFAPSWDDVDFYIDYLFGLRISILNALNLNVSTQRIDKVFCQKMAVGVNLRLIEVNVGLASASTDFVSSFSQSGLNAFFDFHLGL